MEFQQSYDLPWDFNFAEFNYDFCSIEQNSAINYPSNSISSPDFGKTQIIPPARVRGKSPIRHYGVKLLPKIRSQDQEFSAPPALPIRSKSVSMASYPANDYKISGRRYTDPQIYNTGYIDPQFLPAPATPGFLNQGIQDLSCVNVEAPDFAPVIYDLPSLELPQGIGLEYSEDNLKETSLLEYLSLPNPPTFLVRSVDHGDKPHTKYFWWDVRQVRPWQDFTISSISPDPNLFKLLHLSLPAYKLPTPCEKVLEPESEKDLSNMYNAHFAFKLNMALSITQGSRRHLVMRQGRRELSEPDYITNLYDQSTKTIEGKGLGRIVGLVKSFDRWNSDLRTRERPEFRINYLKGLAELQHHMRKHKCRYGFIITEIEVVVVRNGTNASPTFGYLEVQTISLATHDTNIQKSYTQNNSGFFGNEYDLVEERPKMTALLALWYLHMLARDDALPGHFGWESVICNDDKDLGINLIPRDHWIPEPKNKEKRRANESRAWVWPTDIVLKKKASRSKKNDPKTTAYRVVKKKGESKKSRRGPKRDEFKTWD